MGVMVQIDVEALYQQHERLMNVEERRDDLLREAGPAERELLEEFRALSRDVLEGIEDVLDSEGSRIAMEDVRLHGATPWDEVEAELGR